MTAPTLTVDKGDLAAETAAKRWVLKGGMAAEVDGVGFARWNAYVGGHDPHPFAFTPEECDRVIAACEADPSFRRDQDQCCMGLPGCMSVLSYLPDGSPNPEAGEGPFGWLWERFAQVMREANDRWFRLDVTGIAKLSIRQYSADPDQGAFRRFAGDECGIAAGEDGALSHSARPALMAHTDAHPTDPYAKLSAAVQLSDPECYEGGRLEFLYGPFPATMPVDRGTVAVFPAALLHQVTALTAGTRWSINAFGVGPPPR